MIRVVFALVLVLALGLDNRADPTAEKVREDRGSIAESTILHES